MMMTYCEWCKCEFKDYDDIIEGEDGLFHSDNCFNEYCYEAYGSPPYTFKEYKEEQEKFQKRYEKEMKEIPLKLYTVKIYDYETSVLTYTKQSAINTVIVKSPYNGEAIPLEAVSVKEGCR